MRLMTMKDVARMRGPLKKEDNTHLARYQDAFDARKKFVLDVRCPEPHCGAPAGTKCYQGS